MGDVNKRVEEMQKRLDVIQEEIDEARREAENMDPQRPKETYAEMGHQPSERDDTVAPSG
jgi:hypothetical protein